MSYYKNSGDVCEGNGIKPKTLSMALGYVNPMQDYGVTINPRKFTKDNAWADGLFLGQMTWTIATADMTEAEIEQDALPGVSGVTGTGRIFPIVIWFDPDYEN